MTQTQYISTFTEVPERPLSITDLLEEDPRALQIRSSVPFERITQQPPDRIDVAQWTGESYCLHRRHPLATNDEEGQIPVAWPCDVTWDGVGTDVPLERMYLPFAASTKRPGVFRTDIFPRKVRIELAFSAAGDAVTLTRHDLRTPTKPPQVTQFRREVSTGRAMPV